MSMRLAYLHSGEDRRIPVYLADFEDKTLIECHEAGSFLQHITSKNASISPESYIRGVVLPGEGSVFQLLDQFGTVCEEVARLDEAGTSRLLQEIW